VALLDSVTTLGKQGMQA